MRRRFSLGSGTSEKTRSWLESIIDELQQEGLNEKEAKALSSGIDAYSVHKTRSELISLRELAKIHDISKYEHEYADRIDHVFDSDNIAYEVHRVTWNIEELRVVNSRMKWLLDRHREDGKHKQVICGYDANVVLNNRLRAPNVHGFTEIQYSPIELAPQIATKAARKAKGKIGKLFEYDGRRVVVLDLTSIYYHLDIVKRKIRRWVRETSLGKIDGVLLMVNEDPDSGVENEFGLEPVIWSDDLTADLYEPIRPDMIAMPGAIYWPVTHVDINNTTGYVLKQRDGKLILNDEVTVNPLLGRWMMMGLVGGGDLDYEYVYDE